MEVVNRKNKVLFYVIGVIAFIAVLGAFGYINMNSDTSNDTASAQSSNATKQANEFAKSLIGNDNYSLIIRDAAVNPKHQEELIVRVDKGSSDDAMTELGKQVVRDYYHKFKFTYPSVVITDDNENPKVEVDFNDSNGTFDVRMR